tara:strand:+ start:654 stop:926 length:273 start_codon:yes stop_codon:yes gene_type:complete
VSLTKDSISKKISKKLGLSKHNSKLIVNGFFEFIANSSSKKINISQFGLFDRKITPERMGRNPKTKEEFLIKSREKISFKASEVLRKFFN